MDEEEGEAVCTSSSAAAWHLQARRALKHDTAAEKKNMWRAPPSPPLPPKCRSQKITNVGSPAYSGTLPQKASNRG